MSSPSLRAHRVSFAYTDAVPLLAEASFHLGPGWTGLAGANGSGKTTLLRLLAGELRPDGGHVRLEPAGAPVVTCAQLAEEATEAVRRFAGEASAEACRLRGALALEAADVERWATLSPGERKRWQIGAALAGAPGVLLLDEPTNHLDAAGRRLLLGALGRFGGIGVVVSHDRALLDALTSATLRVHGGAVRLWPGGYGAAKAAWDAEERARGAARERARDEADAAARRLADQQRELAAAERSNHAGARMKDRHDHDARGALAKGRAAAAERRLGRSVGVTRRKAEHAGEVVAAMAAEKGVGRSVFVGYTRAPRARVLALDAREVRAGGEPLLGEVHLAVGREDRIRIEGANGAGKTTLLRALLAASPLPADRLLYLPQDLDAREGAALLERIRALPPAERGRVLSLAAALGLPPERLLASARPSPGEARKLAIAFGLGRHVWALVLDEPTNHLDLPSIERLEAALAAFPGALVLVTHDAGLAERCTETAWHVGGGTVRVSSGGGDA